MCFLRRRRRREIFRRSDNLKLKEFFKTIGYDIREILSYKSSDDKYLSWYKGFVNNFHKYYVYNGERQVFKNRYSLNLAKKICENFADFLMNEKVRVTLGTDKNTKIINDLLRKNNFWVKANQGIEKTFALGTGCFLLSLDKKLQIKIQFVSASNIYPLSYDKDEIFECAFVSDKIKFNKISLKSEKIRDIQLHVVENEQYIIKNFRFKVNENEDLFEIPLDDIPAETQTGDSFRWFIPIKPNIINNFNLDSPFGIPIYANSLEVLKSLDLTFDSFVNEIQNGRKRLFVTQDAMKVSSDGCFKNAFDPEDVLFYILDSNFSDNKPNYVQEINSQLRIEELKNAIQTNLDLLSMKLGLGDQYFKFENNLTPKTATEVISENSDLFRTIKKHEQVLENALIELISAIIKIGNSTNLFNIQNETINIDFDDSIIESKEQNRLQDRQDVAMDAQSLVEYRMNWYGEDEQTARAKIEEIRKNNNEKELKFGDEL